MRAILFNKATKEELYWDEIDEDKHNYILVNYKINKYGEKKNKVFLPKFIWSIKEKLQ